MANRKESLLDMLVTAQDEEQLELVRKKLRALDEFDAEQTPGVQR